MSKNSKSRRDAKKKKSAAPRASSTPAPVLGGSLYALLKVDGAVYAVLAKAGFEWVLLIEGQAVLREPRAQLVIGAMQEIVARAESRGSEAAIQASAKLQSQLGEPEPGDESRYEALASKVLAQHPLRQVEGAHKESLVQRIRRKVESFFA